MKAKVLPFGDAGFDYYLAHIPDGAHTLAYRQHKIVPETFWASFGQRCGEKRERRMPAQAEFAGPSFERGSR